MVVKLFHSLAIHDEDNHSASAVLFIYDMGMFRSKYSEEAQQKGVRG